MNPARTFGSAFRAGYWQSFWIYLLAPTLGMLVGAEMFLWARGGIGPYSAKLDHDNDKRCIFRHGYQGPEFRSLIFKEKTTMNKWKLAPPVLAIVLFAAW